MPTNPTAQTTDFSRDVLGRYVCNGLDEALRTTDTNVRSDARPFDIIILGGGTFGAALAQHLFYKDKTHSHRILVLEGGPFALPEHIQNMAALGLNPAPATSIAELRAMGQDRLARNEVWGLAWHSDAKFPGLAYCVGGRSLYWGGWSPQPLDTELDIRFWPADVVSDLKNPYFREAGEQLGVTETNDFIHGELHQALRKQLFEAIMANKVTAAVPLAQLPLVVEAPPAAARARAAAAAPAVEPTLIAGRGVTTATVASTAGDIEKLEAPLAVQSRATCAGFFPANKFSTTPLLIKAARAAYAESGGDDFKKRLMIVPYCHVKRLLPASAPAGWRVGAVDTNLGTISIADGGAVIIAQGTIESTRQALLFMDAIPTNSRPNLPVGRNLIGHLRSNLDIRVPRKAITNLDPNIKELQASALFVKGRHTFADGTQGHFHLQITASGLGKLGTDSEAELFKKIPDIDGFDQFKNVTDSHVVITIRGIGEMERNNNNSFVTLDNESDEYGARRAFVGIDKTPKDNELWDVMDKAADDVAKAFARSEPLEILSKRRDGLGTTHHEGGTLAMGIDPATSVTDSDGRIHGTANVHVAGPALFPTLGSPNPMLTGVALGRRLADKLAIGPTVPSGDGFQPLFDGANTDAWRMATIKNQPGRDNPGSFIIVDAALESIPGTDIGLFWCATPTPPNFILKLDFLRWQENANSGVFLRFPDPESKNYNNAAYVAVDFGFEVQIDETGAPDGAASHKTGAIYNQANQTLTLQPARPVGQWNEFEIRVVAQDYTVLFNGHQVTKFTNTQPGRGLPTTTAAASFIGLQTHTGRVAFRNIRIKAA
jgi:choline dehydrogenase-like flavoprotein